MTHAESNFERWPGMLTSLRAHRQRTARVLGCLDHLSPWSGQISELGEELRASDAELERLTMQLDSCRSLRPGPEPGERPPD